MGVVVDLDPDRLDAKIRQAAEKKQAAFRPGHRPREHTPVPRAGRMDRVPGVPTREENRHGRRIRAHEFPGQGSPPHDQGRGQAIAR